MKKFKVKALSVGGSGRKIFKSGDIVKESDFDPGRASALVAEGFLEPHDDSSEEEAKAKAAEEEAKAKAAEEEAKAKAAEEKAKAKAGKAKAKAEEEATGSDQLEISSDEL